MSLIFDSFWIIEDELGYKEERLVTMHAVRTDIGRFV